VTRGALEGLRVLDLTQVWAGPNAMRMLGDMGADVIKVESARRFDSSRGPADARSGNSIYPNDEPGERPWNRVGLYNCRNRSKRGACLDLTQPRGVEAFKRLVGVSDIVGESFRAGALDRLGLGYEALRAVNPRIILVSLSSQGATGPERSYVSFGAILEQTGGVASITGYLDGPPTASGSFFPDPVVGMLAVGIVLAAVRQRDRTGEGMHVDLSQREVVTSTAPEMVMDYTMNGRIERPMGNRHPVFAPQGVYRCRGEGAWLAITVRNDEEWAALVDILGWSTEAAGGRFRTVEGRRAHHDELDALIERWTAQLDPYEAMRRLQERGVPAGVAQRGDRLLDDPQLAHRGFWELVDHPEAGSFPYLGRPFRLSRTPAYSSRPAPLLGEHTHEVLREVAGMSDAEIAELDELGVTADVPEGAPPAR
jgi:benzylsuccinate CoA-transferase BbsF subunit